MEITVGKLLDELEKPENEGEIQHLVHLKNLSNLEGLKEMRGIGGFFSRLALSASKKHIDAFMALSECKTTADIAAFKQTEHYDKIKNATTSGDMDLSNLASLEKLQDLKDRF